MTKTRKTRKTGTITRPNNGDNRLTKVVMKRDYMELWHANSNHPLSVVAFDVDRKAWQAEDWEHFENVEKP